MPPNIMNDIVSNIVIHFIVFIVNVGSVPPDYCLHPLNTSDCKVKPTPVFYYYLSGSRCEIKYWRGCPTLNKFDNEYDCSDLCIYRFGRRPEENVVVEQKQNPVNIVEDEVMKELLEMPLENLTILNEMINEIDQEKVLSHVKLHKELPTFPPFTETENTKDTQTTKTKNDKTATEETAPDESATAETVPEETTTEEATTEETTTEEATTETTTEADYESGLPEEVETP